MNNSTQHFRKLQDSRFTLHRKTKNNYVQFEVLAVVKMITLLWYMTLCSSIKRCHRSGGGGETAFCHHEN
jgi:hypothetical protein